MHDPNRRKLIAGSLFAIAAAAVPAAAAGETDDMRDLLTAYAQAWRAGDVQTMVALYHPDFTLYYPGEHALAGTHRGRQESLRVLAEVGRRTQRQLVEIMDIMVGERRGALNVTERWSRGGEEALLERVFVYTAADAKLRDCRLFDADQAVVARFLGA